MEFFGPLCDLVEGSLEVDVAGLETADRVDVPSLAELCVRSIHSARLGLFIVYILPMTPCRLGIVSYIV